MPRPVVALPCGSESIKSTRRSLAASEAAKLIAVVVLPTPPFWLAIAIILATGFCSTWNTPNHCFTWNHRHRLFGLPKVTELAPPTQCENRFESMKNLRRLSSGRCLGLNGERLRGLPGDLRPLPLPSLPFRRRPRFARPEPIYFRD